MCYRRKQRGSGPPEVNLARARRFVAFGLAVALAGAALVGVGDDTTTVREVLVAPPTSNGNISQTDRQRLTLRDIYRRDAPGVVQVTSTTKVKLPRSQWFGNPFGLQGTDVQQSLGSGFVIDKAGLVVTNYHVIGDARTVYVSFSNSDLSEILTFRYGTVSSPSPTSV